MHYATGTEARFDALVRVAACAFGPESRPVG